jgi:hypothetical protein
LLDGVPTGKDSNGTEQSDEDDKPEAEAVYAHVIGDCRILNPRTIDYKLKTMLAKDEVLWQMQGQAEADERCEQRYPSGQFGSIGKHRNKNCTGERG